MMAPSSAPHVGPARAVRKDTACIFTRAVLSAPASRRTSTSCIIDFAVSLDALYLNEALHSRLLALASGSAAAVAPLKSP